MAFAAYIAVSFFVLIHIGRHMWFYEDDWTWFRRDLTFGDLFHPFFQHWVTLPLLLYNVFFRSIRRPLSAVSDRHDRAAPHSRGRCCG